MLQPPQLEEASVCHAAEIAEARQFLTHAGVLVESADALAEVVRRLGTDRGFHRDLTLHVWVWMSRTEHALSYADMLAVLAIAAMGQRLAASAREEEARNLLRFLLEARRQLDGGTPVAAAPRHERAEVARPTGRRRAAWVAVAGVALSLAATWWIVHRPPVPAPPRVGQSLPPSGTVGAELPQDHTAVQSGPAIVPAASKQALRSLPPQTRIPSAGSSAANVPSARVTSVMPPLATTPAPVSSAVVALPTVTTAREPEVTTAPRAVQRASTESKIVPEDSLSRRLGARSLPSYALTPEFEAAWHPRLLRRTTNTGGERGQLIAELSPVEQPAEGQPVSQRQAGIVRPAVLGMMAGNILYSPSPAYPSAASAAHVQGEVRVQAEVDRDGNVSYARVVSGPPLLRAAAIEAVQHWRYKPYLAGGKAVPMTSIAVLEFELP